jgi:LPXTG-motif cell wall-anchored protein
VLLAAVLMLSVSPSLAGAQTTSNPASAPPLSQTPPAVSTQTQTQTTTAPTTTTTATTPAATASQLPNTGADPRVLALLGCALLLAGVGLHLRSRHARRT